MKNEMKNDNKALKEEIGDMATAIAHTLLDHVDQVMDPDEYDPVEVFKRLERLKLFADAARGLQAGGLLK